LFNREKRPPHIFQKIPFMRIFEKGMIREKIGKKGKGAV
jgi:hypothetical protein